MKCKICKRDMKPKRDYPFRQSGKIDVGYDLKEICAKCYAREYYKVYRKDPEKRKRIYDSIKKYQQSENGKKTIKRYKKIFQKTHPNYINDYMKKWKIEKIKQGFCGHCFTRIPEGGYITCKVCRDGNRKYYKKRGVKNEKRKTQRKKE